ncbi:hypothetical protein C8R44DRAFT_785574 [Mycena epipterygia]|nr:hypothetical protein C8R44DRAFT_785574 [Mycena epipterygia]
MASSIKDEKSGETRVKPASSINQPPSSNTNGHSQFTCFPRTFVVSEQQTVEYNEHRGPRAPPATLGEVGDIYLDVKAPALYARCHGGWTAWPGPQARGTPLAHPAWPDFFLWVSIVRSRVVWASKPKMKKLIMSAPDVLKQIIAMEGRRDSKNLKRKAGEAPSGTSDAKKSRVSESTPSEPFRACTSGNDTSRAESTPTPAGVESIPSASPMKSKSPPAKPPSDPEAHTTATTERTGSTIKPTLSKPTASSVNAPVPHPESGTKPATPPVESTASSSKRPAPTSHGESARKRQCTQPPTVANESSDDLFMLQESTKADMCPVEKELKQLQQKSDINLLKGALSTVGRHIEQVVETKEASGEDGERNRRRLWAFTSFFWPAEIKGPQLQEVYEKSAAKLKSDAARPTSVSASTIPRAGVETNVTSQPQPLPVSEAAPAPVSASPALVNLVTLMRRNTESLKSKTLLPPVSSPVPSSAQRRSTARPTHPPTTSTAQRAVAQDAVLPPVPKQPRAKDVASLPQASKPERSAQDPIPRPSEAQTQHEKRPPVVDSLKRADVSSSPSDRTLSSSDSLSSHGHLYSLPQAFSCHPRRSASRSAAPSVATDSTSASVPAPTLEDCPTNKVVLDLTPIAVLRSQYARYQSKAAAQRKTDPLWTAESSAAAALIDALKRENDVLKAENDAIKAENKRLGSVGVPLDHEKTELQIEEERVDVDEGEANADTPMPVVVPTAMLQTEEEQVLDEGGAIGDTPTPVVVPNALLQRKEQVLDEGEAIGDEPMPVVVPNGLLQREQVLDEGEASVDTPMPVVVQVKEEPASVHLVARSGIEKPAKVARSGSGITQKPEIIDLTLDDSDDEDVAAFVPVVANSSASMPATPAAALSTSGPAVDATTPEVVTLLDDELVGDDDELFPEENADVLVSSEPDVSMGEETDTSATDLHPQPNGPTLIIDVDLDPPPSSAIGEPPVPASSPPTGLVTSASALGYFRVAGADFNYSDKRLRELVALHNCTTTGTSGWGGILSELLVTTRSNGKDPFEKGRWQETVEALRDYYVRCLLCEDTVGAASDVVVPPLIRESPGKGRVSLGHYSPAEQLLGPGDSRDIVIPDVEDSELRDDRVHTLTVPEGPAVGLGNRNIPMTAATSAVERDSRLPAVTEESSTLSIQAPSSPSSPVRDTPPVDIDSNRAPTAATTPTTDGPSLMDPTACKNVLPALVKVKTEEAASGSFFFESAAASVCGGRLNQTHLELLFPSFRGDPLIVCAACESAGVKYELAVETPLEELSAHMEENHLEMVEGILAVTQGMSREETRRWFASLD